MLATDQGKILLKLARGAIAIELGIAANDCVEPEWSQNPGATFVTLTLNGQLRGCMGSLEASRPLLDDVQHNAVASAFHDPRFDPLSQEEFHRVVIDVSLLSGPEIIVQSSQTDALSKLTPGTDGVILQYGAHRATYLPQVWEQLPEAKSFIAKLKRKAGLAEDFWSSDIKLSRYSVQNWSEDGQYG
ncbi:MAG: AmmeMemoRadiSam system protein A [Gallionella sp.]